MSCQYRNLFHPRQQTFWPLRDTAGPIYKPDGNNSVKDPLARVSMSNILLCRRPMIWRYHPFVASFTLIAQWQYWRWLMPNYEGWNDVYGISCSNFATKNEISGDQFVYQRLCSPQDHILPTSRMDFDSTTVVLGGCFIMDCSCNYGGFRGHSAFKAGFWVILYILMVLFPHSFDQQIMEDAEGGFVLQYR